MSAFHQPGPHPPHPYNTDGVLRGFLRRRLPPDALDEADDDLRRFGDRALADLPELAADAERHEPRLTHFDAWGRRVDRIDVAQGWRELDRVSAEEGLVAIGYERRHGPLARLHQFAKLFLFAPVSAVYTCPLAMTDGAARLIEKLGDAALCDTAFRRLTSRDPATFWTSGQWMTERTGGSDVGRTETIARHAAGAGYRLYGAKWFTSATTSQMAMTLARITDAAGNATPGSRGLSLFYLETRDAAGQLNHIHIHRLKDKLGTRALPTAELSLEGTHARLLGAPGEGVRTIAALVNVTRIYNAAMSAASMRHGLALARDYAFRREAFGRPLAEQPLHVETLADMAVESQAAFHLAFRAVELLGREECGEATADETAVLRILVPLAKLYTARQCVAAASETLEAFGGAGYVEDTGLPKLLRDAQVLAIWEGTTNVLSLDVLRAIDRDAAFVPLLADAERLVASAQAPRLAGPAAAARAAIERIRGYAARTHGESLDAQQAGARAFAFALARTYTAALLLDEAQWSIDHGRGERDVDVACRFARRNLAPLIESHEIDAARRVALETAPHDHDE